MEIEKIQYQLVKGLLNPPIRLVAVTPGTIPEGSQFDEVFDSIDAAQALSSLFRGILLNF